MLHNTGILTITVLFQIYLMHNKIIRAFIISVNKKKYDYSLYMSKQPH